MAAAAAAAADSFVRFCTDLFSTVLKCIREREGKGRKERRARARRQNDDSLPSTRIQKSEIGFGRGRKREIHEYWVRSALLHSPRAPHTGPPAVQRPAANKISTKKGTDCLRVQKTPKRRTGFKKPKKWRLLSSRPNELFSWSCHAFALLNDDVENSFQKTRDGSRVEADRASERAQVKEPILLFHRRRAAPPSPSLPLSFPLFSFR